MKFDLIEINKLSPPNLCGLKLWDLGVLASVIALLREVMRASAGGGAVLVYGRMVLRYSESLRDKTRDNLNMRIKAWVLRCPHRIAHVRRIIGTAAIRNWRKNRLANYALTKYFGNWKHKFPDGFAHGDTKPKRQFTPIFTHTTRAYKWKLFALVKIVNVQGFLYRIPGVGTDEQDMRDAYFKLWGVEFTDAETTHAFKQPRGARTLDPIRFTPDELEPEEGGETSPSAFATQDTPKRIESEAQSGTVTNELLPDWQPP